MQAHKEMMGFGQGRYQRRRRPGIGQVERCSQAVELLQSVCGLPSEDSHFAEMKRRKSFRQDRCSVYQSRPRLPPSTERPGGRRGV
jgi:hypothetical protein